jgi:hypothetical protein
VANIQVTHSPSIQNARSESSIAVNPNNTQQVVSASKRFNNIHTYDFTLATQYSQDGGQTWHDSAALAMPGFTVMTDPTLAWDDIGNVYLVGLTGTNPPTWDTIGIVIYTSTDGGQTWSDPNPIHNSTGDDKQWAAGDSNPASPFHGNVYAVWDNGGIAFAKTSDHGGTWTGTGANAAGQIIISDGSVYPEIDVSENGTVYVVSILGSEIVMYTSTDGGDSFPAATAPATGIHNLEGWVPTVDGWPELPGGTFRVISDPTVAAYGETVLVAWADYREGVSRIYYARSLDSGTTWTTGTSGQPMLGGTFPSGTHHIQPQMVVDGDGVFGCVLYEFGPKPTKMLIDVIMAESFDGGETFGHFTVTDQPWDPTVDAPWAHGDPKVTFIGDYMGLSPGAAGFHPVWTDTRTGIQELWTDIVPEKGCRFIVNRSTLGQDEVDALRQQAGGTSAVVHDAFRVVVDGFSAGQIGATGPGSQLTVAPPTGGMTITCTGNSSANGDYGPEVQRFTYFYDINFGTSDTAFGFSQPTETLTLEVSVSTAVAEAQIELIKQPDPFILHGDPAWLSIDLRVFVVRPGDTKFGVSMGPDASHANDFIQQVMRHLSNGNGTAGGQSFDDPAVLPSSEEGSALYLQPTDESNTLVFNFALARVRYIGLIGAHKVRAFFRLFSAQITTSAYDYPPGQQYRRGNNGAGDPIPLAGVANGEYTTIPFFALPRVDSTAVSMTKQTDTHTSGGHVLGNVQKIDALSSGDEVDTFFGCWLDINQPFKVDGVTPNNVLPASAGAPLDGPFQSSSNPPLPISQAIARNLHQCLITEIAFDPTPIPIGADTSDWDKLAQRNIAWSPVGSAQSLSTFEIRPSTPGRPPGEPPDELMIDWGDLPDDGLAEIYLPGTTADEILSLASRLYTSNRFERVDDHTIVTPTAGVTYVPVPPGSGANYAGLLTVGPPAKARPGQRFDVVVRQITNAGADIGREKGRAVEGHGATWPPPAAETAGAERPPVAPPRIGWRKVTGAFQLAIPVGQKNVLLRREERDLSVLRWIGEAIPHGNRWHPVFHRYLQGIAGRVATFGGDPGKITPSPWGTGIPGGPGGRPGPGGGRPGRGGADIEHTGKVSGLRFDQYGDFSGFTLHTGDREIEYWSRERHIAELAERAWRERLRITVWSDRGEHRPETIVVREPPVPFHP